MELRVHKHGVVFFFHARRHQNRALAPGGPFKVSQSLLLRSPVFLDVVGGAGCIFVALSFPLTPEGGLFVGTPIQRLAPLATNAALAIELAPPFYVAIYLGRSLSIALLPRLFSHKLFPEL